ncbi:acetyltransferase [Candidatus Marinamargulisbacteria bacterium SCGC AG-333-B06]|nr:acetyltransferase [Candidatus Marinamargulisbacteria bacterium SCGC AG-333-B06]
MDKKNIYCIVGFGGFGREVMPVAHDFLNRNEEKDSFELVFVDDSLKTETMVNGYRSMSRDQFFQEPFVNKYYNISISDYRLRSSIVHEFDLEGCSPFSIFSTNSICLDNNKIGEGAIFCPFTTVTSNVKIGQFFHCNIYSYLAHDCIVGDFVTFSPNVHCNGNVYIHDNVYIGTGAIIKQGDSTKPLIIGEGSVVGMGSVVNKNVAPYTVVVGNPARCIKIIRDV